MLARLATFALLISAASAAARAQSVLRDDFEGPETSLREPAGDGTFQLETHRRVQQGAHSGRGCEQLTVRGNNGTYVYLSRSIPPARVIGEWTASIWLKADRPGLQLVARVVLPRSMDPRSGKPLTTLVRDPDSAYKQAGVWQQLRIDNLPTLLERQIRVLRARFGREVDAREAYVDRLLVNIYGGPGATNVAVDDLEVSGIVAFAEAEASQAMSGPILPMQNTGPGWGATEAVPTLEFKNPLLLVGGKPFFLRSIDHNGEPLTRLQSLGFNAARLRHAPTGELLREAARAGFWLIAPPPPARALEAKPAQGGAVAIDRQFDPVLAWDLGSGLSTSQLESTKRWAKLVAAADPRRRPILCDADSDLRAYTRSPVKIFAAHRDPIGSTLPLGPYQTWLRERTQLVVPGTPLWAAIQTEPSPRLTEQAALVSAGRAAPGGLNEAQLRILVRIALAAGARGLRFESNARLDAGDSLTARRAAILELVNLELDLIERWPAAGNVALSPTTSDPAVSGGVIETDLSRLLLPIFGGPDNQIVLANPGTGPGKKLSLIVSGVPEESAAWELSPVAFRRLPSKRVTRGTQVVFDEAERDSLVVFTQDPLVVRNLQTRVAKVAQRATQLTLEVAKTELAEVDVVERRLAEIGRALPATRKVRTEAQELLATADSLAKTDVLMAYSKSRQALSKLRDIERAHWDKAQARGASPLADPLVGSLDTLAEHYRFDHELNSATRGPNLVPEGIFEQLDSMRQAGWAHYEHPPQHVTTTVDLLQQAAHSGHGGLRLRASLVDPKAKPGLMETPPLWITSPSVRVERGDLMQIQGWVRTPAAIVGSVDGLLIVDTLSGETLAQRIGNTDNKWQEFKVYRAAGFSGVMNVTIALTGLGEACVDDISIQIIERPRAAPPQQAQNVSPLPPTGS